MKTTPRNKWAAFFAVLVAAVACAVNQFKIAPVLGDVQARFGMSLSEVGWVSSVYALAILALAVPGAVIINKYGMKKAAAAGLAATIAASTAGAFAGSPISFVALRVLEGVGQALLFVIGPTLIATLFSERQRGLPLGIFNCAIPIAVVIAYNCAIPIRDAFGLSSIWLFCTGLQVIAFLLVLFLFPNKSSDGDELGESGGMGWSAWANVGIVLCCLTMCGSGFRDLAYTTWSPTYYADALGLPESVANFGTSMEYVALVAGSMLTGLMADRVRGVRALAVVLVVIEALTCAASVVGFSLFPDAVVPYMAFLGVLVGSNVTLLYALLARVARNTSEVSMGSAMITVFLSLGQLLGPPASGALVAQGGWTLASVATVGASAVMVACAVLLAIRNTTPASRI